MFGQLRKGETDGDCKWWYWRAVVQMLLYEVVCLYRQIPLTGEVWLTTERMVLTSHRCMSGPVVCCTDILTVHLVSKL